MACGCVGYDLGGDMAPHANQSGPNRACAGSLASLVPAARIELLKTDSDAVANRVEMTARSEHGARAMRMPPRVAEAFGVTPSVIPAPVRQEQQELAGLSLDPPRAIQPSIQQLAQGILQGDLAAADRIAGGPLYSRSLQDAGLVQSLRQRRDLAQRASKAIGTTPSAEPGQGESSPVEFWPAGTGTWEPGASDLQPAVIMSASLLPRSNRALGRRTLTSPALDGSAPNALLDETTADLGNVIWGQPGPADLDAVQQDAMSGESDPSQTVFPIVIDPPNPSVQEERLADPSRGLEFANPAGWPVTTKLDEQLDMLTAMAMNSRRAARDQLVSLPTSPELITDWTEDVMSRLQELRSLPRLGDPHAGVLIDELMALASEGLRRAEQVEDRAQQIQWLGTAHAVARRVAVWRLVWEVTRGGSSWMVGDQPRKTDVAVSDVLAKLRADLDETGDVEGWSRYLMLDEIDAVSTQVRRGGSNDSCTARAFAIALAPAQSGAATLARARIGFPVGGTSAALGAGRRRLCELDASNRIAGSRRA